MMSELYVAWVMATSNDVELTPAYVLHQRNMGEHALMVDFLTRSHGRVSVMVPRRQKSLCRPFQLVLLSWHEKKQFRKSLTLEVNSLTLQFAGRTLFSAMYLNELVMRLLVRDDPTTDIFHAYQQALIDFQKEKNIEAVLRKFEIYLLGVLGYSYDWHRDARSGEVIDNAKHYGFMTNVGFVMQNSSSPGSIEGLYLQNIYKEDYDDKKTLNIAKYIMRNALAPLLGDEPLHSRQLFLTKSSSKNTTLDVLQK
jgi:DNA repair protein RecO (recombination protein O)